MLHSITYGLWSRIVNLWQMAGTLLFRKHHNQSSQQEPLSLMWFNCNPSMDRIRILKFEPNVHLRTVQIPNHFGLDWPGPLILNFKRISLGNWLLLWCQISNIKSQFVHQIKHKDHRWLTSVLFQKRVSLYRGWGLSPALEMGRTICSMCVGSPTSNKFTIWGRILINKPHNIFHVWGALITIFFLKLAIGNGQRCYSTYSVLSVHLNKFHKQIASDFYFGTTKICIINYQ